MDEKTTGKIMKVLKMVYDAGFTNEKIEMIDVDRILFASLLEIQKIMNAYAKRAISGR